MSVAEQQGAAGPSAAWSGGNARQPAETPGPRETRGPRETLEPMARLLCDIESRRGMTPVLVIDHALVLADEFYVNLCRTLVAQADRAVRLDLLPGHRLAPRWAGVETLVQWSGGPWLPPAAASAIFSPMRKNFLRRLARQLPDRARIEATAAVARPGGALRELVVGLAGPGDELPAFAQEIAVGVQSVGSGS